MDINKLIEYLNNKKEYYAQGNMCSIAESIIGESIYDDILKYVKQTENKEQTSQMPQICGKERMMTEYVDLSEKVTVIFHDHGTEEMGKRTVTIKYILDKCCCDGYTVLESAQPETIHCKDCKHWMPYDWMFSEVWRSTNMDDYSEDEIGCVYCDMNMDANDFCSKAERKE